MTKQTKLVVFIVALAVTSMFLAGCTGLQGVNQNPTAAREVQHSMGITKIPGTPQKVVVLTNEASDILLALGVKPVGAVKHWQGDPWYDYLTEALTDVQVVGEETQPNLEAILALKPDLIIGSKLRHEQIYTHLSAIAPTVFSETVGTTWKSNTLLYAEAINRPSEGAKLISAWDNRIAEFKQRMGTRLATQVSIVRFQPTNARIYYQGFPGSIIAEAGLARPQAQIRDAIVGDLSIERIPEMDGDVIFYFVSDWQGDGKAHQTQAEWMNHDLWKSLEAVKADKVYQIDEVFWNMAGGIQAANRMLEDLFTFFLDAK